MTNEKDFCAVDYILGQLNHGYIDLGFHDKRELKLVESSVRKQMPQKPTHIHEEYAEHDWQRDKNGEIDTSAWGVGFCNGPICKRCFHSECEHCNPKWETEPEEPCVIDKDVCPVCGSDLKKKHKYCYECGQALDWSE